MYGRCTVDPWVQLSLKRFHARKVHRYERLCTADDVATAVRKRRKEYLGSDLSLEMFVRKNGMPNDLVIRALGDYLAKRTAYFIAGEGDWDEFCSKFYHYSLQLFATGMIGEECVDDLIQLGACYECRPMTFYYVMEPHFDDDMMEELQEWIDDYDYPPPNLERAVLGAISVFLGVIPDPFQEAA